MVVSMLRRLLVSWAVMAVAVALTAALLPGISVDGGIGAFLLIALVWGLVDGLLGPIARFVSLPLTLLSFGLFALVVNGALFALTAWVVDALDVDNFLWAIVGAIVLSIFTWILSWITGRAAERSRAH
jgi:putative membrane protein